jgi:ribonuclease HII
LTKPLRPAGPAPNEGRLREAAIRHLARFSATEAGLRQVLLRRIDRWAQRAASEGLDPETLAASRAAAREAAYERIMASAIAVAVGEADVTEIDRLNILHATMAAMKRAVGALAVRPEVVLVDGNRLPKLDCPAEAIVGGDALCLSIAAASIVAKVTRDRTMIALGSRYPGYGFEKHKGYATAEHHAAIRQLGVTEHHRRSVRTVQLALGLVVGDAGEAALAAPREA